MEIEAAHQSPPCQRGVVLPLAKPGGFRGSQVSTWVYTTGKVPAVNPSVTPPACQLPFTREPCGQCPRTMRTGLVCNRYFPDPPGIVPAVEVGVSITSIKYHPQSKPELHRPQAPSVTCGDSSLPEGAMGFCLSTLDFCKLESDCCNPSGKNQRFLPAPFDKGAFGRTIDTGRVREVTNRRKLSCALTAAARRL